MASEAEVLKITGYPLGAVSPLGISPPLRVLVDGSVFHEDEISIGSGIRYTTVIMRSADLRRALGMVEIGDFSASDDHRLNHFPILSVLWCENHSGTML
jgi:prolyl-tRNA editing enzyme YbaK/EbsC (Cys-tRNA(Pro) deacylase)